jgi:hypothetical protein
MVNKRNENEVIAPQEEKNSCNIFCILVDYYKNLEFKDIKFLNIALGLFVNTLVCYKFKTWYFKFRKIHFYIPTLILSNIFTANSAQLYDPNLKDHTGLGKPLFIINYIIINYSIIIGGTVLYDIINIIIKSIKS